MDRYTYPKWLLFGNLSPGIVSPKFRVSTPAHRTSKKISDRVYNYISNQTVRFRLWPGQLRSDAIAVPYDVGNRRTFHRLLTNGIIVQLGLK